MALKSARLGRWRFGIGVVDNRCRCRIVFGEECVERRGGEPAVKGLYPLGMDFK